MKSLASTGRSSNLRTALHLGTSNQVLLARLRCTVDFSCFLC
jgi:hypothetical protein